jgi:hypothetical protein
MRTDRGQFAHRSPNLRHDLFDSPTPEADWLAGLLAADGCVRNGGRLWQLGQSGDHGHALIESVRVLVGSANPISTHSPRGGAPAHTITITSPSMVTALAEYYGIGPRKTRTLRWPDLAGSRAAAFLRGYVDGDGTLGVYRVSRAKAMLNVAMVGTPGFVDAALSIVPSPGRRITLRHSSAIIEARWSGRYAWRACQWLYQHGDALPESAKRGRFRAYEELVRDDPPAWLRRSV